MEIEEKILNDWDNEITSILSKKYKNHKSLVGKIVSLVLDRMKITGRERTKVGKFLCVFLETDSYLVNELKELIGQHKVSDYKN